MRRSLAEIRVQKKLNEQDQLITRILEVMERQTQAHLRILEALEIQHDQITDLTNKVNQNSK
jgi:hypothetical protein